MPQTLTETGLNLESRAPPMRESGFHFMQKHFNDGPGVSPQIRSQGMK
jgi:hypothetical protein